MIVSLLNEVENLSIDEKKKIKKNIKAVTFSLLSMMIAVDLYMSFSISKYVIPIYTLWRVFIIN